MTNTQSFYQFHVTFAPPTGEPPITQSLNGINLLILLDAIRRADRRMGRPSTPRDMKLKHILQARDQIRARPDALTQNTLSLEMGFESDRCIRRWLKELGMTWQEFLSFEDF
jgi:hypothetical protein